MDEKRKMGKKNFCTPLPKSDKRNKDICKD